MSEGSRRSGESEESGDSRGSKESSPEGPGSPSPGDSESDTLLCPTNKTNPACVQQTAPGRGSGPVSSVQNESDVRAEEDEGGR